MNGNPPEDLPRLVDLAVEWLLQYAGESTVFDPGSYPGVRDRLGQVEGYLSATSVALVWFGAEPGDRPDPWGEAGSLMSRVEAEFAGRLLTGPDDLDRLVAEPPDGLTWAVAGLRGVSALLRSPTGPDRLAGLVDRGVRAVRLAGLVDRPPAASDDPGLPDEGRSAIEALAGLASTTRSRLMVDLAGLGPRAAGEAIGAVEPSGGMLVPIVSLAGSTAGLDAGLRPDDLGRLRSLGGVVGLGPGRAFHADAEAIGRAIEATSAAVGIEALAIGTGFLGIDEPAEGIGTAPGLIGWLSGRFGAETARRIASENARVTINRVVGGEGPPSTRFPDEYHLDPSPGR